MHRCKDATQIRFQIKQTKASRSWGEGKGEGKKKIVEDQQKKKNKWSQQKYIISNKEKIHGILLVAIGFFLFLLFIINSLLLLFSIFDGIHFKVLGFYGFTCPKRRCYVHDGVMWWHGWEDFWLVSTVELQRQVGAVTQPTLNYSLARDRLLSNHQPSTIAYWMPLNLIDNHKLSALIHMTRVHHEEI